MLKIRFKQGVALGTLPLLIAPLAVHAQAPAAARQLGTVKTIDGNTVTLTTTAGAEVTVTVAPDAPVLQLPPGSTDLKAASPAKLDDVAVGDRILASGAAGDTPSTLVASRIILMKSSDIAARNAAEQRDWQRRGLGGLVRAVDGPVVTVVSGAKVLKITTTPTTVFKEYARDSVNFADAQPGSLGTIHAGDQLRARGVVSDDRLSMTADEVVSGTFENLSGVISSVDQTAQTLTMKDLTTKKTVTLYVTQKSDLRKLPPQALAAFNARNGGAAAGTAGAAGSGQGSHVAGAGASSPPGAAGGHPRNAGLDLSQMLSRLPTQGLADLKAGEAVMVVASEGPSGNPTAITLLSGVEQILSATPSGGAPITLSPWNLGSPEGAAGAEPGGGR
jgi:hypothetical protein